MVSRRPKGADRGEIHAVADQESERLKTLLLFHVVEKGPKPFPFRNRRIRQFDKVGGDAVTLKIEVGIDPSPA